MKHLTHTRGVLIEILYHLLPAREEGLITLQEKSLALSQHAEDFFEEAEEKAEPLALQVLTRKVWRKTVSLVRTFLEKILTLVCACWGYLRTVCMASTKVPSTIEYDF